jgi:hypothetical protein
MSNTPNIKKEYVDTQFLELFFENETLFVIKNNESIPKNANISLSDENQNKPSINKESTITTSSPKEDLILYGNLKAKTLIFHYTEEQDTLYQQNKALLKNILAACNVPLGDTLFCNIWKNKDYSVFDIKKQIAPTLMFIFGVPTRFLSNYELRKSYIESNCFIFVWDSLDDLDNNKDLKIGLWKEMKNTLNLT